MCWTTYKLDEAKPIVSKEPKKVFKVVDVIGENDAVPHFYHNSGLHYHEGQLFTVDGVKVKYSKKNGQYSIESAFHSYDYDALSPLPINFENNSGMFVNYNDKEDALDVYISELIGLMECVIPAGTTYYKNGNGEVASEAIMPVKITSAKDILNC